MPAKVTMTFLRFSRSGPSGRQPFQKLKYGAEALGDDTTTGAA